MLAFLIERGDTIDARICLGYRVEAGGVNGLSPLPRILQSLGLRIEFCLLFP